MYDLVFVDADIWHGGSGDHPKPILFENLRDALGVARREFEETTYTVNVRIVKIESYTLKELSKEFPEEFI